MGGEDIQLSGEEDELLGQSLASEEERGSAYDIAEESESSTERGNASEPRAKVARLVRNKNGVPDIVKRVRDNRGRYRTSSLFLETRRPGAPAPVYTLREFPKPGLICARQLYLEANDPTEYAAALSILGSWEHWQHLCGASWFKPIVDQWRSELKQKLLHEATQKVIELCGSYESSSSLAAAKKLMEVLSPSKSATRRNRTPSDERSEETGINPVGRPPKTPVLNEISPEDTDADLARILELG